MPRIAYVQKRLTKASRTIIDQANLILTEYQTQGYTLTLRQLYYQFVSRGWIENNLRSYKNLGETINQGRLAGLIDWYHLEDRTRNLVRPSTWENPQSILNSCVSSYKNDLWADQGNRPEVWIEKDALGGIFSEVCGRLRIGYFSCRGYTSQSEMWEAAQRLEGYKQAGQHVYILHFGDHDPSGIDMSRDIQDRLALFGANIFFNREALNMDQVTTFNPPPNPAKVADSRYLGYMEAFGDQSWELDALPPNALVQLVENAVDAVRDDFKWAASLAREESDRNKLASVRDRWKELTDNLGT